MAEKQLIWSQNSRLWGVSQDPFLWSSNQYEHSYNISYRNNIKWISLWPTPILWYTASAPIIRLYRDSSNQVRWFANNWDIYKDNVLIWNNDPDWASLIYFNVVEFRPDKLFVIYFQSVYEIDTSTNTIVFAFTFPPAQNIYERRAVAVAGDVIYRWVGNILYYTNSSIFWLPQVQYTASSNEEIYYISQYLDQLRVYTFLWTNDWDTIQYMLHKWVTNQYQYRQIFPQVRLVYACTDWPNDYFVNISNLDVTKLWVFSWPNYQRLYKETNQDWRLSFNSGMRSKEWLVYIGWSSKGITDWTYRKWIFISWKYLPQYPNSINVLYADTDQDDVIDLEFWEDGIVFSKANKVYTGNNEGVLSRPTWSARYSTQWELTSRKFYGESMAYRKKIDEFWLAWDIPSWCSVDVYYSVDDGNRQFAQTIDSTTIESRRQRVFTSQISKVNPNFNEKFHSCQYKLVLKWNWFTTPIVYELNTFYSMYQN